MLRISASIKLPPWLAQISAEPIALADRADDARMRWAIELAARNVAEGTGGPFAAIVVEETQNQCVAAGVNLVIHAGMSIAHAEAVAIMLAQLRSGTYDLAGDLQRRYTLYATGQPCIMCFGVLWWSGITRLVCAARGEDVEQIARFHEGPVPGNWKELLSQRPELPIEVICDVQRNAACEVLRQYAAAGGPIYNPGSTA